jgi:hypothetical protein
MTFKVIADAEANPPSSRPYPQAAYCLMRNPLHLVIESAAKGDLG